MSSPLPITVAARGIGGGGGRTQAQAIGKLLGLRKEAVQILQEVPYKGISMSGKFLQYKTY